VLPSVGEKKPQISLSRGVVLYQSIFHLVSYIFLLFATCMSENCMSIFMKHGDGFVLVQETFGYISGDFANTAELLQPFAFCCTEQS